MFVVAFICLNAGGAACVAYCQTFEITAEDAEHCPLKNAAEHCDKSSESGAPSYSTATGGGEIACCPMTVNFFAVPFEKNSISFDKALPAAPVETETPPLDSVFNNTFAATFNYRGPPPLDRRSDRIKQRLLLI